MLMLSCFSCIRLFEALRPVAHQAPLFMRFSRQEYWSGMPCPSPRDLPDPGIKLKSPTSTGRLFTAEPPRKPHSIFGACEYTILIPEPGGKSNWTKWAFILKL